MLGAECLLPNCCRALEKPPLPDGGFRDRVVYVLSSGYVVVLIRKHAGEVAHARSRVGMVQPRIYSRIASAHKNGLAPTRSPWS